MEMGTKVCIDTDVLINSLKNHFYHEHIRETLVNKELYITTVTVFELYKRQTNIDKVQFLISGFNVLDFNISAALVASILFKYLQNKGIPVDHRDLFIAAISLANDCELLTNNIKDFKNIPNLKLVQV